MTYLLAAQAICAQTNVIPPAGVGQRKALFTGPGDSWRELDGGLSHAQRGKKYFLLMVGNPSNDPAKGWTCDMT